MCGDPIAPEEEDTQKLVVEQTNRWVLKHRTKGELCTTCWSKLLETIASREQPA